MSLKNCLTYQRQKKIIVTFRKFLVFFLQQKRLTKCDQFTCGYNWNIFFTWPRFLKVFQEHAAADSIFSSLLRDETTLSPVFDLLCHGNYVMDDGVFSRWVNLSTSSNRFVKKLISIKYTYIIYKYSYLHQKFYCKLLLMGPGPKQV